MTSTTNIATSNLTVDSATIEKFLAAKQIVSYKHNVADAKIWYINNRRSTKALASKALKTYDLTIDTYLAAQKQWIDEKVAKSCAAVNAELEAEKRKTALVPVEFYAKYEIKINTAPAEANPDDYAVSPDALQIAIDAEIALVNAEPIADDFIAQLATLKANRDNAEADFEAKITARKAAELAEDKACAAFHYASRAYQQFGIDKANELCKTLITDDIILHKGLTIRNQLGELLYPNLSQIRITFQDDGKFEIRSRFDTFATYDNPAHVTSVFGKLKTAIANGDTEFAFPTVEELNAPKNFEQALKLSEGGDCLHSKFALLIINGEKLIFKNGKLEGIRSDALDAAIITHTNSTTYRFRGQARRKEFFLDLILKKEAELVGICSRAMEQWAKGNYDDTQVAEESERSPDNIADSLKRAMTFAQERYKDFCYTGQLSRAEYELKLYAICREALKKVTRGEFLSQHDKDWR